jgi:hypothetical protein
MSVLYAARFATFTFLIAAIYTGWQMWPGLYMVDELSARQNWMNTHAAQWGVGGWLWLLSIFSWMMLFVTLMWGYLPAHRIAGMLQSGLMIIAAVLAIAGITIWMNVLPLAFAHSASAQAGFAYDPLPIVDALALAFLGSGCFMGGITTAWIAFDLIRQQVLARAWLLLPLTSGLSLTLASLLHFNSYLLLLSFLCWMAWCIWISVQRALPSPFSTWPET